MESAVRHQYDDLTKLQAFGSAAVTADAPSGFSVDLYRLTAGRGDLKNRYGSRLHLVHVLSREPRDVDLFSGRLDADRIRRILIFAYIYEGTPNWAGANGVVTLFPANGPEIEVRLDEADQSALSCAIALFENRGGELVLNREVRYIRGAQDKVDEAYGWGMNWRGARK